MTTIRLDYSAALARAEILSADGAWHPLTPDGDDAAERDAYGWLVHSPPMGHPIHHDGALSVRVGYRYRAPTRLLSRRPPFGPTGTPRLIWQPSAVALELGLDAPAYDGVGYLYLSASAFPVRVPCDTILAHALLHLTPTDAALGAAAALRRAYLVAPAEQVMAARSVSDLIAILERHAAALPAWIESMGAAAPTQIAVTELPHLIRCALAIARGEALPEDP